MLADIQSAQFLLPGNPKPHNGLDNLKDNSHGPNDKQGYGKSSQGLNS